MHIRTNYCFTAKYYYYYYLLTSADSWLVKQYPSLPKTISSSDVDL